VADPLTLAVRVVPRSRRAGIEARDGHLIVRVTAAPIDGEANEAVRKAVADAFGVRPRHVEIVAGQTSRDKRLEVVGADPELVAGWVRRGMKET